MLKKVTAFLLFIFVIFVSGRAWYHYTDGLTMSNITDELEYSESTIPLPVQEILAQKFTYFAKGCQSYAFLSDDGKYVLKCFKQKHLKPGPLLGLLPPCKYKEELTLKKAAFKSRYFSSIETAYRYIPDLCGLEYVHLGQCGEDCPIQLVDKLGFQHTVSSNELPFILQKYGIPMKEYQGENVKEKLVALLKKRESFHVRDNDPAFMQNVAFVDDEPIFVDVGQMEYVPGGFSEDIEARHGR